jgi:hypothetical protein
MNLASFLVLHQSDHMHSSLLPAPRHPSVVLRKVTRALNRCPPPPPPEWVLSSTYSQPKGKAKDRDRRTAWSATDVHHQPNQRTHMRQHHQHYLLLGLPTDCVLMHQLWFGAQAWGSVLQQVHQLSDRVGGPTCSTCHRQLIQANPPSFKAIQFILGCRRCGSFCG